jgi:dipeptidase E
MRKLLLVSSSRVHGTGFLEHCRDAIAAHFSSVDEILFIPYALQDHDRYESIVADAMKLAGQSLKSIHHFANPIQAVEQAQGIFIGGGNSFRLLKSLYDLQLIEPIRAAVLKRGAAYMGSSAGTNMACPTIRTSNDMPIVQPPSFDALDFIPFQINPHFIDADPQSKHKGETREQRLAEFHEENSLTVAGLREGSWFEIRDDECLLCGKTGMKLFRPGETPEEINAGCVDYLLKS